MPAMTLPSPEAAIQKALEQNWKEAIRLNLLLLKHDTSDIDSLNRLGFAYLKSGQLSRSKRTFHAVLKLDPYNQISLKNLKRLTTLKRKTATRGLKQHMSPLLFLEEPGKTKIALCVNLAPVQILSSVSPGQEVYLKARNHVVEIRDEKKTYLGALPDDLSFRLIHLLTGGNRYQVVVKGTAKNSLTVILREVSRGKRYAHHPSFTTSTSFIPFGREKGAEAPDVTPTGEESEEKSDQEG